jgi:HK97 family phage major capsid protein
MIRVTPELKAHMVKSFGIAADASDEVVRKAIGEKIAAGELDLDTVQTLSTKAQNDAEARVKALAAEAVEAAVGPMKKSFDDLMAMLKVKGNDGASAQSTGSMSKAFAGASSVEFQATGSQVDVKSVAERFDDTRTAVTYDKSQNQHIAKAFAGKQVNSGIGNGSYDLNMPTERSKAISGAWFKHLVNKSCKSKGVSVPYQFRMNEQDQQLVKYAVNECKFVGPIGYKGGDRDSDYADHWCEGQRVSNDYFQKALLDDSTSGGLEAVPIEFDSALILTPILNGELFPLVTVRNVTRRRIEATAMSNPTLSWGVGSGTAVSLFNTSSLVSAFDTTIYPVVGAMEVGRDFLSDSPLDIGNVIVERYGQVFLQELDSVIASGDGTTQPEGLFTASGISATTPVGGNGSAQQVGDYELLMHGIAKQYMQEAGGRAVFIGNQTSYQRSRSIPVDTSNDARRIFGQDNQGDYRLMGFKYAIASGLSNAKIGFFCMNRYRMYRRQGLEVSIVGPGDLQSTLKNTQTIVVRARFGGALETAAAGAKMTAAQA